MLVQSRVLSSAALGAAESLEERLGEIGERESFLELDFKVTFNQS